MTRRRVGVRKESVSASCCSVIAYGNLLLMSWLVLLQDATTMPNASVVVQALSSTVVSRYINSVRQESLMPAFFEAEPENQEQHHQLEQQREPQQLKQHLEIKPAPRVVELVERESAARITRSSNSARGGGGGEGSSSSSSNRRSPQHHPLPSSSSSPSKRSTNPAEDPVFLRKRTANLLNLTADASETAASGTTTTTTDVSPTKSFRADKKTFHFLMDAWAFSGEPDADIQAQALLKQMDLLNLDPDVRSYTKVMNAMARSGKPQAGENAEAVLETMAFLSSTERGASLKPNTFSYTAVVEAYANSGSPGSALEADKWCREMVQKYRKGDATVRPTARAFHAVITAYGKSGEVHAGMRAQAAFDLLESLWKETRLEDTEPNVFNYNALITAWANCPAPGSVQRAREVLRRMEDLYKAGETEIKPTTVTFNAVIDAYAKSSGDEGGMAAAEHAEELLRHMEDLYQSGANVDARPNVRSYNSVLNVWAKSGHAEGADRAQEILGLMENLYNKGNEEVRPDVHSFCTVINAWAKSSAPNKADRAMNLFREMQALYRSGNHEHLKPNVVAYNAVMNACAFCNGGGGGGGPSSLQESSHAMEMAHAILQEMEQSPSEFNVKPDQVTYGTFLKVCAHQLPDCSTRQQIVEMILKNCVRDGQVGSLVLQQLKTMVNEELYLRLVGKPQSVDISMEDLPQKWWCNVVEGKWRRKRS